MLNVFKKYAQHEVTKVINTASYSTFTTAIENHKNKEPIHKMPQGQNDCNTDPTTGLVTVNTQYGSIAHTEVIDLDYKDPMDSNKCLCLGKLTTNPQEVPEPGTNKMIKPVLLSTTQYNGKPGNQYFAQYTKAQIQDMRNFKANTQGTEYVNTPDIKKKLEESCQDHQKYIPKND